MFEVLFGRSDLFKEVAVREVLLSWIPWGVDVIVDIQSVTGGFLDVIFRAITYMGQELLLMVLLSFVFWSVGKRQGLRLASVFLISAYLNVALKELLAIPRPFEVSQQVQRKVAIEGSAFPSGHAQGSATIWPSLAHIFSRRWMRWLAVIMIVLISFSRVYLGVHYPQDVIAGILVGLVIVAIYFRLEPSVVAQVAGRSLGWQLAGVIGVPSCLMLLVPVEQAFTIGGGMIGLGVGCLIEARWIDFVPTKGRWPTIGRLLVGLIAVTIVYGGLKLLFPAQGGFAVVAAFRVVRYVCVGLAATLVAPWIFVRLGLATKGIS
ncbi:MAG: hypothetical protein A2Y73_04075 [Chloroflexi bacterium RBG_13_56_8]|nr:MAG: hypothetical protein A2Y73_04075 [Chloroflexi bacterium RBG_13_56_8]